MSAVEASDMVKLISEAFQYLETFNLDLYGVDDQVYIFLCL